MIEIFLAVFPQTYMVSPSPQQQLPAGVLHGQDRSPTFLYKKLNLLLVN